MSTSPFSPYVTCAYAYAFQSTHLRSSHHRQTTQREEDDSQSFLSSHSYLYTSGDSAPCGIVSTPQRTGQCYQHHHRCLLNRNKCRVYQLDFIGAFLQANVRGRIFVSLPKVYGDIWPEFKDYCGRPLRLVKSMYGMTYSGKYWYLDLKEWLLEEGFIQSRASPCFFCKIFLGGYFIKIIIYVDDKLFFGNNILFKNFLRHLKEVYSHMFIANPCTL